MKIITQSRTTKRKINFNFLKLLFLNQTGELGHLRFRSTYNVTLPKDGSLKLLKENKTLALEKFTFHLRFESKLLLNFKFKNPTGKTV